MPDTALQATRTTLLTALGLSRGWGDNPDVWMLDSNYASRGQKCVDLGVQKFYNCPPLPGEKVPWKWSFLTPFLSNFVTVADQTTYNLPDDFVGFVGTELFYATDDNQWIPLSLVGMPAILRARQQPSVLTDTRAPNMAAVYGATSDGTVGQRWKLDVFPTPDAVYTLTGQYRSNPLQLTGLAPYPLGGQPHSLTLEFAVCAAGELIIDGNPAGPFEARFQSSLYTSVWHDRQYFASQKKYGINTDPGARPWPIPRTTGLVTYNGVAYPGT